MVVIYKRFNGTVEANYFTGNGSNITNISINNVSGANANAVAIYTSGGILTNETYLSPARGGTGINTSSSTGIPKISSGTWSISTITDSDISNIANISRTKLASGSSNHVLINDGSGIISSEQYLSTARGGLGINLSTSGGIDYAVSINNSVCSVSIPISSTNLQNSIVKRDTNADIYINDLYGNTSNISNITSVGNLTISSTRINTNSNTKFSKVILNPDLSTYEEIYAGAITIDSATSTIYTFTTSNGGSGCSYAIEAMFNYIDTITNSTGNMKVMCGAYNKLGVASIRGALNKVSFVENDMTGADITITTSSANILFNVIGVASKTIKWFLVLKISGQEF